MSATGNERTKRLATAINTVAVAFVVIGAVTPITAVNLGVANAPAPSLGTVSFAAIWLCTGIGLHGVGRRVLRSLKP